MGEAIEEVKMIRQRASVALVVCVVLGTFAATASAQPKFRPRVGGALGLVPPFNKQGVAFSPDIATGAPTQVTYHGGSVMSGGVTVHTIFWDGGTQTFPGSPQPGAPSYEGLIEKFFSDVAAASTGAAGAAGACSAGAPSNCNVFTVLPQFAQGTTPGGVTSGSYSLSYDSSSAGDVVLDHNPYPPVADQCDSPQNTQICVTDGQVQSEIDSIAPANQRGLHNFWFVFLPPNVDECISPGACGTNAFGAYHSEFDISSAGLTIYAVGIDPIIEVGPISPGTDPNGNPDAEATADAAGHETVEAMTDPQGVGWMDPNGFEVADKCEFGSQFGTPLGNTGPDHAEFNQVINHDDYLVQEMWSNDDAACVQGTSATGSPLPLPQVNMTQFSSVVTGNIESPRAGVGVQVSLIRPDASGDPVTVSQASTTTAANGTWSVSLAHAVGDDRDEIDVDYSGTGAPSPHHQVILTGNGGNPFTESGWTGWTALDNGTFVTDDPSLGGPSVSVAPCFQTGVLGLSIDSTATETPTDFCSTQTGAATVHVAHDIGPGDTVTVSTNDNRAFAPPDVSSPATPNPNGGLVDLTVGAGEADAVSTFESPMAPFFEPSGFPTCTADLELQMVSCSGLVAGNRYTLTDGSQHDSATADDSGTVSHSIRVARGDQVTLSNGSRTLTALHVAHLRVGITGEQDILSGGSCEPGQYYGPGLSEAPTNSSAGDFGGGGSALTGEICPMNGDATGLSDAAIEQTDERSAGTTQTEVPDVENTSPIEGETVDGTFVALAQTGLPGPDNTVISTDHTSRVALKITRAAGGSAVFTSANVDTVNGVRVAGLAGGTYTATWTLSDANGDTRAVTTRFIEHAGGTAAPKPNVKCKPGDHRSITCAVRFGKAKKLNGTVRMRIASGTRVIALGHGRVRHGKATVSLHVRRSVPRGKLTITVVLSRPHHATSTRTVAIRVR
jgi:hypothetical protein